jgi:glycosyltransferase involved in cell wall biosynthesis
MATTLAVHRPTWRSVDRYIALTTAVAEHLQEYGIPEDRIVVKPNSVPDPGRSTETGDGFLFAGRLSEEKGLPLLLDAWRQHPDGTLGRLTIIGDGELRPLAAQAANDRADVEYLGALSRDAVQAAVRRAAVVVVPSVWHDVLPTVVIEALANGRPVLGTALGGIPYLVDAAGWIVAPDRSALAAALPVAKENAAALAPAARRRYETTFHPDVVTKQLLAVYQSMVR